MFKTQQDIWKHLVNGNAVINKKDKRMLKMIDGSLSFLTATGWMHSMVTFLCAEEWEDYQEPKWYENLGKGILSVFNESLFNESLLLIVEYDTDINQLVSSEDTYYRPTEVRPATEEEVKKYIFRGEING